MGRDMKGAIGNARRPYITFRQSYPLATVIARSEADASRYFVHHHLVGNAAQRGLFADRLDRLALDDGGDFGRADHRLGDVDLLVGRQALHPRRDIHGLAEIVLALVEHDRKTRDRKSTRLNSSHLGISYAVF